MAKNKFDKLRKRAAVQQHNERYERMQSEESKIPPIAYTPSNTGASPIGVKSPPILQTPTQGVI